MVSVQLRELFVPRAPAYDGVKRESTFTQVELNVSHWNEYVMEGIRQEFAELAVHRFKDWGFDMHENPSVADQRVFIMAEVADVREVVSSGSGLVRVEPGEIVKTNMIVEDDYEDWHLEGIIAAGEVAASDFIGKMRVLQEKFRKRTTSNFSCRRAD